jgi:hypothetical protein
MPVPAPEYDPIIPWWFAPALSLLSLVIAGASLGWNLFLFLTNKPKARVRVRIRKIVVLEDGHSYAVAYHMPVNNALPGLFIVMTVVNLRSRPIRWTGWGGEYSIPVNGSKEFQIVPESLPKTLNDGEDHSQRTLLEENARYIKFIRASDSTGRDWKPSWWELRKFKREVKDALAHPRR